MASATWKREHPRNARGRFVKARSHRKSNPRRARRREHLSSSGRRALRRDARSRPRNRFVSGSGRKSRRKNPRRYHHERWSSSAHPRNRFGEFVRKRGSRRHNPPGLSDFPQLAMDGLIGAGEAVIGKAAARAIPGLVKLPTAGNTGLAIQALVAVALSAASDYFGQEHLGEMLLVGGLMAPIETLIEDHQVPYLSSALQTGTLSAWSPAAAPTVIDRTVAAWSPGPALMQ